MISEANSPQMAITSGLPTVVSGLTVMPDSLTIVADSPTANTIGSIMSTAFKRLRNRISSHRNTPPSAR